MDGNGPSRVSPSRIPGRAGEHSKAWRVVERGPSLPRNARKSGQDRRAATLLVSWAVSLAGLVALAACSTGPLGVCFPDPQNPNTEVCPAPETAQFAADTIPRNQQ